MGNIVTASSFSSYLKTIHDRNDSHMRDVIKAMEQYQALPWLVDYWIEHAKELSKDMETKLPADFEKEYGVRLAAMTVEQAESLPESMQYEYAKICYSMLDRLYAYAYKEHNLDDLFLIVSSPGDSAMILFDAEKNADGYFRLGEYRDLVEERKEWGNYDETVSSMGIPWIWGHYSREDDFGFYDAVDYGGKYGTLLLCNSFRRSEVYDHLNFISGFRMKSLVLMGLSALVILLFLYFTVIKPMALIERSVKAYHIDKDAPKVRERLSVIRSKNEIGTFAEAFSMLAQEMEGYTERVAGLAREQERVSTELGMAYQIQSSVLPSVFPPFPERDEFDIYADMIPAKEVGGDFYDFLLIGEERLVFLIADVSGKGVPAALFMMSAKKLVDYRAQEGGSPADILSSVNEQLCRDNAACMFVTMWLGILDLKSGELSYANGGHEAPALRREGIFSFLDQGEKPDLALGLIPGKEYTDFKTVLSNGDAVFLYTDGVKEATDLQNKLYGPDRLIHALNKISQKTPREILEGISSDIGAFVGEAEQFDDITMLCLDYKKQQEIRP